MSEQLLLPLSAPLKLEEKPFLEGPSNIRALSWIKQWPDWSHLPKALILEGPKGSGKTHLARTWAHKTHARSLASEDLPTLFKKEKWDARFFLLDDLVLTPEREEGLFHLYNHILLNEGGLLLTSAFSLSHYPFTLTDLASRLRSLPIAILKEPTEKMFRQYFLLMLSLHDIALPSEQVDYLTQHLERTFDGADAYIKRLVHVLHTRHVRPTFSLIKEVLEELKGHDVIVFSKVP